MAEQTAKASQKHDFKLFDDAVIQPPPILESLVPPFPQQANTEESIIEVLKYSQKDMDAAIAKVQAEVCPAQWLVFWQNSSWQVTIRNVTDDPKTQSKECIHLKVNL